VSSQTNKKAPRILERISQPGRPAGLEGLGPWTYIGRIRLAITSDLHVDHHPEVIPLLASAIRRHEADVLIVAGDLTASDDLLEKTLALLRPHAAEAVFVPGNHDLWCRKGAPSSRERYESILPARAKAAGFHSLGAVAPPRLFGHRFVGVTGWYDYTLRNRSLDDELGEQQYVTGRHGMLQWSDKLRVIWPGADGAHLDDPAICDEQVRSLEAQIAAIGDEPAVAVTHHLPFAELVTVKNALPWDFLNGFMGSSRLGDAIRRAPGMRLSVSGHTHFRREAMVAHPSGPLRALTSPLGYPREYARAGQTLAERVVERVQFVEI
jgi:3',5'-cyclic AMP phosphodiesterase CpdA